MTDKSKGKASGKAKNKATEKATEKARAGRRRSLGRGLEALLGSTAPDGTANSGSKQSADNAHAASRGDVHQLPVGKIVAGKYQPRRHFNDAELSALADSVREKGILQPILVRPHPDVPGHYELVAGERRWRAAQRARLHEVPVLVLALDDRDTLEIALVENVQRQDLSAIEEALGYKRLMDDFDHSQEELGRMIGKSRSHVANMLRLLSLPSPVQMMVEEGKLSAGHARALIGAGDPVVLARVIVEKGLSVRETERLASQDKHPDKPKRAPSSGSRQTEAQTKDTDTLALEAELEAMLGLKVDIRNQGQSGHMVVHYQSLEQFDDLLLRLGRQ